MINTKNFLNSGEEKSLKKDFVLFNKNDETNFDAIYYIKKGFVTLTIPKTNSEPIKVVLKEGDLVGLPEVYNDISRLTKAVASSDVVCQVWDKASFLVSAASTWELSIYTIKSLSKILKLMNSEYINNNSITLDK